MSEIIIRETRPEDAEAIIAYLKRVGGETDNLTFGAEGLPVTVQQESGYIKSVADNPRAIMLTAWRDGELVGECSLSPFPRRMQHRAELGITVAKAAWNSGIGSAMMEKLIAFACSSGTEIINLEVRSDNSRAIHLYEKFGFRRIGTSPAYVRVDGIYQDAELMYLDLRGKCIQNKSECAL